MVGLCPTFAVLAAINAGCATKASRLSGNSSMVDRHQIKGIVQMVLAAFLLQGAGWWFESTLPGDGRYTVGIAANEASRGLRGRRWRML